MVNVDTATEHEIRQWFRQNGGEEIVWIPAVHPLSAKLREDGYVEAADALDDLHCKHTGGSQVHVLLLAEVKAKVREMQNAQQVSQTSANYGSSSPQPEVRQESGYTTVRG